MTNNIVIAKPSGAVSSAFAACNDEVRCLMGPIGSGKSTRCIMEILKRSAEQRRSTADGKRKTRWAVVRNTYPELISTTVKTWHQWVPKYAPNCKWREKAPMSHEVSFKLHDASVVEAEILFLALDRDEDVGKLLSLELTGIYINEARQVPGSLLADMRGRIDRYPPMREGGCSWSGIFMDTNPPDVGNWIYQIFEKERPEGFRMFRQPSGLSPQAENIENLPKGYYEKLLTGNKPEWVDVYVHGKYGYSRDGKPVYPEFIDNIHVPRDDLEPIPDLPIEIGMDAGMTPAAVIGQTTPSGQCRCIDEIVMKHMGPKGFGEYLARYLEKNYKGFKIVPASADPAAKAGRTDIDDDWITSVERHSKLRIVEAPSNSLSIRLDAVRNVLGRMIDGQPGFLLSPKCKVLREGFNSGYRYKRIKTTGGTTYMDVPEKNEFSHVHDGLQYWLLGNGEYYSVIGREKEKYSTGKPEFQMTDYDPFNPSGSFF